jgi:hypothetical protein
MAIICVASQLFLCFFWIHLWVKNRCLQHLCLKILCKIAQASKNSDSNAQHFLSDLLTHSWFHSMLFALPCYQFPYIVMNRCLYLRLGSLESSTASKAGEVENPWTLIEELLQSSNCMILSYDAIFTYLVRISTNECWKMGVEDCRNGSSVISMVTSRNCKTMRSSSDLKILWTYLRFLARSIQRFQNPTMLQWNFHWYLFVRDAL